MTGQLLNFTTFSGNAWSRFLGILVLLPLLVLATGAQAADQLRAEVDRKEIALGDTFTLTLRLSGSNVRGRGPDVARLQNDFDILSNQSKREMRIINGQSESWTEWQLQLSPLRAGTLTIPAMEANGAQSQPIEITVNQNRAQPADRDSELFIETELDKERIFVQEQLLFTVRVYSKVNLDGAEMQDLNLQDAVIKAVDENNYLTQIGNRQHLVLETTFALFPQKSGELVIPSLAYDVVVARGQRDPWGSFYGNSNQRRRLRTEEQRIEVQPIPDNFSGDTWLPARDVELSEHWSTDPQNLTQGEPVTRRITLKAEGLTAAQLPPLETGGATGLNIYPDQPQTEEQVAPEGISSSRIQTLAMVPNQSGRIDLPAVTLEWWDTDAGEMRQAQLPARELRVEATPGAVAPPPSQTPPATDEPVPGTGLSDTRDTTKPGFDRLHWWLMLGAALLLALVLILAVGYWRLRQELRAIHDLHRQDHRQTRVAERSAWADLKRHAQNGNLPALREALLVWGRCHWPDESFHSLRAVAERSERPGLLTQVQALDATLFGGQPDTAFDSKALLAEVDALRTKKRKRERERDGLKPLYKPG